MSAAQDASTCYEPARMRAIDPRGASRHAVPGSSLDVARLDLLSSPLDTARVEDEHDRLLRLAAFDRVRDLSRRYDDLVPLPALREGFEFAGRRISYGSFYNGIYRPKEMHGPAALALVTTPPKTGKPAPYEDTFDETSGRFSYRFRDAGSDSLRALAQAEGDNRTLIEAYRRGVPLIYFRGIGPGQYTPVAPVFATEVNTVTRTAGLEVGLPEADTTSSGLVSDEVTRRYATREAAFRLHQHRFRRAVLHAYARAARSARSRKPRSSRRPTSWRTATHAAGRRWSTACRCARSTTSPTTATF